jgi:predicted O-methyltransferase YrrM
MFLEYRAADFDTYRMDVRDPHRQLEEPAREIAVVDEALTSLQGAGVLPHVRYDRDKMLAHRRAVAELFEIPWTAITPRMQRLLYAVNAIARPANMIAAGVFCGNTFISNAGAAVGPGTCYTAESLIGLEIKPAEAQRAERNVRKIDPTGVARVLAADAVEYVADFDGQIDLLYLDADGDKGRGKGIYLEILQAALDGLRPGSLVLAHNSHNAAERLKDYLAFVRDAANFRASVNCLVDGQGLEASVR